MAGGIRESFGDEEDLSENHEINVTPFIDVILVLMIIFMVAAPLATVDVDVDLPASNSSQQSRPEEPLFVSIKNDLTLTIGINPVTRDAFGTTLAERTGGDREQRIFLRGDKSVPYGEVMAVMNLLRAEGYLKVALVGLEAVVPMPAEGPTAP